METSRDDFVIAVRSAFLKKGAAQRFSLFGLIIFSCFLLSLEFFKFKPIDIFRSFTKDLIYRGSFIVSVPFKSATKVVDIIDGHFSLYKEYNELKDQINVLKLKQNEIEFLKIQNRELKLVVQEELKSETNNIISKVLIDKQSPFIKSIILNKGSNTNLKKGMLVLSKGNMIGRIIEVNYLSSRVLLISDLNSKIPVKIGHYGENGIMTGVGDNFGELDFLPKKSLIKNNDLVFTSGSDGIFKEGIPIGKIVKKDNDKNTVEFFVDLNQINFVTILNYKKDDK